MSPTTHDHVFDFPRALAAQFAPFGAVDTDLLGRLVAAGYYGCPPCQAPLLERIGHLPVTVGTLAGLSVALVTDRLGGLPANLYDPLAQGVSSTEYRQVIAAGLDGAESGVVAAVQTLTPQRRRRVAEDALELTVGFLVVG